MLNNLRKKFKAWFGFPNIAENLSFLEEIDLEEDLKPKKTAVKKTAKKVAKKAPAKKVAKKAPAKKTTKKKSK